MIITIDGPSGTGKTTIANGVAKKLNIPYFDTGAMYRSVAWAILEHKIELTDEHALKKLLDHFHFEIRIEQEEKHYFVNGVDVTKAIRTQKITSIVSQVSVLSIVREAMWKLQREYAKRVSAVFEGRDMGSVVFPKAELKIFLTASSEVRAKRRLKELQDKLPDEAKGWTEEKMVQELERRDLIDAARELAPLTCPKDATVIDTSNLTIHQVVETILDAFHNAQKKLIRRYSPAWLKAKKLKFFYRFSITLAWIFFKLCYRNKIYGLEHYYKGAAIIAPNHTSYLDPPLVGISWPEEVHFLAREGLFKPFLLRHIIRALNSHPVHGDAADVAVFKTVLGLLSRGKKIVLFPEGERTLDGQLGIIKPGIGLLLSKSQAALIPTYLHGTHAAWGRGRKFPKFSGKTAIVFGTPILWKDFAHLDKKEAQKAIAERLQEAILNLKDWYQKGAKGISP